MATPAVFFDLDGTLIDVSERNYAVYSRLVQDLGADPLEKATYWDLKRNRTGWADILAGSGLTPAAVDGEFPARFIAAIELPEHLALDWPLPGAIDVVDKVRARHEIYLVTLRRSADALRRQLDDLGLTPLFTDVLTATGGVSPAELKADLIRPLVAPGGGVVVGDTEADVGAAQRLALASVAVWSGLRHRGVLEKLRPDYLIADVSGLPEVLENF